MSFDIEQVLDLLEKEVESYQTPIVDLISAQTRDPFRILVATILSARTRDQVTADVCRKLFLKAPDVDRLAELSEKEIEKLIYPSGFYKNKARFLSKLPEVLRPFDGNVPDSMDDLLTLPGVGRKTANLVLSVAFNKPAICVDTHVHRIMNVWGYVKTSKPEQTEIELRAKLPLKYWRKVNYILVSFGQETCRPVSPKCDICVIQEICPALGVVPRKKKDGGAVKMEVSQEGVVDIVSWNVNGIRAVYKKGFTETFSDLSPDILAIQETRAWESQLSSEVVDIPGYNSYWADGERKGYSGVAVYSRIKPLNVVRGLGVEKFDREGRVITLEFDSFFLLNAYFPNAQNDLKRLDFKLEFNRSLTEYVSGLKRDKGVIICGDFNVAHKPIDLANPKQNENNAGFSKEEREGMDGILEEGFIDSFRKFNQDPDNYTWWSYRFNARARNIGWRIDYFLVDRGSDNRVLNSEILSQIKGSDHCPVRLNFKQ